MREFEKWFKKAEGDLHTVQLLLKDENCQPDICCSHSQQAAEKYLKAYLVSRSREFPYTHDLRKLIIICKEFNSNFREIEKIAERLTEFGVTPRYPDGFDNLIKFDAQQAYENAIIIKEFILKHFFQ